MNSQESSSNDVTSQITDISDQEVISDDVNTVNTYFHKVTSDTGKVLYKCSFCDRSWVTIVTTAKKGHLANLQLAKLYSTTLCSRVPRNVSLHFTGLLTELQQKKAGQKTLQTTMENRLSFQKESIVGTKRLRQPQLEDELLEVIQQ